MPGLANRTSPSVPPGNRSSSSRVTTVTVANWSATIGSQPGGSAAAAGGGGGSGDAGCCGAGRGRAFVAGRAFGLAIGLGAVTWISGSATCAVAGLPNATIDRMAAPFNAT